MGPSSDWQPAEVRTRRLIVVDENGHDRIIAEVVNQQATLRLLAVDADQSQGAVTLYAAGRDREAELGPSLGIQLRAHGNGHVELNLWEEGGRWHSEISSDDP